jgi:hypothetical protein
MLDVSTNRRHLQLRRLGNDRIRREVDAGADCAVAIIVVAVIVRAGLLREQLCSVRLPAESHRSGIRPADTVEMNMSEGHGDLQRQRAQGQKAEFPCPELSHGTNCNVITWREARGSAGETISTAGSLTPSGASVEGKSGERAMPLNPDAVTPPPTAQTPPMAAGGLGSRGGSLNRAGTSPQGLA